MSLASTVTIPALARKRGIPRRTLFRQLIALHASDRERDPEMIGWLFRFAGGPWRVNMSRLTQAHPELFEGPSVETLDTRVTAIEKRLGVWDTRQNALAASFRKHREHETKKTG